MKYLDLSIAMRKAAFARCLLVKMILVEVTENLVRFWFEPEFSKHDSISSQTGTGILKQQSVSCLTGTGFCFQSGIWPKKSVISSTLYKHLVTSIW